ncbi:MAG: ABC transporter permease [Gemmatimonadota bacterium]
MKTGRIVRSAFGELGRSKLRTFFMMVGIVIGITAVTMVVAVGLGAERQVMKRVQKFGLDSLMVFAGGGREIGRPVGGQVTTLTLEDRDALLREIPEIAGAAPFQRQPERTVKYRDRTRVAAVFGVTNDWEWVWDWHASRGRFVAADDERRMARVAVIGESVRRELFGDADPVGEQIRIGKIAVEVIGVLESRGTGPSGGDMDNRVIVPLSTLMRRMANVDHIAAIKVLLNDARDLDDAVESIEETLRERHYASAGEPDDFRVISPDEVAEFAGEVAGTFNVFLVFVAGISLIAGGFVIGNIMLISVGERRAEIGLRKAVGARRRDIRFQFLLEVVVVTVIGGLSGVLLGLVGAAILGRLIQLPLAISWESVVLGVVFSAIVGIFAGLQPAGKASRMQPVEALRGQ